MSLIKRFDFVICKYVYVFIASVCLINSAVAQESIPSDWSQSKILIEQKFNQQYYNEAIELLEEAMKLSLEDSELGEAYLLFTKIALKTGKYEVAEFYLKKLEPLVRTINDRELKMQSVLTKLWLDYRIEETLPFLSKLREIQESSEFHNDPTFQVGIRSLIILCFLKLEEYDSSLVYINRILKEYKTQKNQEQYSNELQNKAHCLIALNQPDSVLALLNHSIQIARSEGLLELHLEGLFLIGKYYLQFGPKEAALMHLDAARLLTQQGDKSGLESRVFLAQYYFEFYLSEENYKEALLWQNRYISGRDSLYREELSLKSAFSDSMRTIADQQSKISKTEIIVALLIISLAIIGVFFFMQRRLIKLRSKTTEKLRNQYHSIKRQRQALLDQKESIEKRNEKLESFLIMLETLANSSQVNQGNTQKALEEICRIIQESLKVSRVSIWNYYSDPISITSRLLLSEGSISDEPSTLFQKDFPNYFRAIQDKKLVIADDALTDTATYEFKEGYLDLFNIKSMLDAPILVNGELSGIICCEHTGEQRKWDTEETIFLLAVSDFISITLLSEKIKSQNEILVESNLSLEDSVRMRTMELELQNKQLAEYAFVNSHLLRSPLAKILGIAEIMKYELRDENKHLVDAMTESAEELDVIVKQIGQGLYNGKHFSRTEINTMKKNIEKSQ